MEESICILEEATHLSKGEEGLNVKERGVDAGGNGVHEEKGESGLVR